MKDKSKPPMPTAADRMRSKIQLDSLKKAKTTPAEGKVVDSANRSEGTPKMAKGGKASCGMAKGGKANKFGAAMVKKSADTKGRAMKKYAMGGVVGAPAVRGVPAGRGNTGVTGLDRAAAMSGRTFKKGGKIDGCATKGKTKGKIV